MNTIFCPPEDKEAFFNAAFEHWAVMKSQPGFISAQLHQGVGGANLYVSLAVWESMNALRHASADPAFASAGAEAPSSVVLRPVILKKVAVPNICVA
jgi:heme-degrading monooxygenase HmoA